MPAIDLMRSSGFFILALVVLSVFGASLAAYLLWRSDPEIVQENRLIEWAQAVLLMLSWLVHGVRGLRTADYTGRALRWFVGMACLSMMLRELDVDKFAELSFMPALEDTLRWLVVGVGLVLGWWGRHAFGQILARKGAIVTSQFGVFSAMGLLLYLGSSLYDKELIQLGGGSGLLIEETLQLNATIFLLAGAICAPSWERTHEADLPPVVDPVIELV